MSFFHNRPQIVKNNDFLMSMFSKDKDPKITPNENAHFKKYKKDFLYDDRLMTQIGQIQKIDDKRALQSLIRQVVESGEKVGDVPKKIAKDCRWNPTLSYTLVRATVNIRNTSSEIHIVVGVDDNNLVVTETKLPPEALNKIVRFYPSAHSNTAYTKLDQALKTFDLDAAQALVKKEQGIRQDTDFWRDVAENKLNHPDLLRAMLILYPNEAAKLAKQYIQLKPNTTGESRISLLHHKMKEKDPQGNYRLDEALRDRLRAIPYFSDTHPVSVSYNGQHGIFCAERSTLWTMQRIFNNGKSDYPMLTTRLLENADVNKAKIRYQAIVQHTEEVYLVLNAPLPENPQQKTFGDMLFNQFQKMKPGETVRLTVESPSHAMSLDLKVKFENGKIWYVANFHDPNGDTHIHVQTDCLEEVKSWILPAFLASDFHLSTYYKGRQHSLVRVIPSEATLKLPPPLRLQGRSCNMDYTTTRYTDDTVFTMLVEGFDQNLDGLKDILRSMPAKQAYNFLMFKALGNTGCYAACLQGHAKAFKKLCEAMEGSQLLPDQILNLLTTPNKDGTPPLLRAWQSGHTDIVEAFLNYLPKSGLSPEQIKNALKLDWKGKEQPSALAIEKLPDTLFANDDVTGRMMAELSQYKCKKEIDKLAGKNWGEFKPLVTTVIHKRAHILAGFNDKASPGGTLSLAKQAGVLQIIKDRVIDKNATVHEFPLKSITVQGIKADSEAGAVTAPLLADLYSHCLDKKIPVILEGKASILLAQHSETPVNVLQHLVDANIKNALKDLKDDNPSVQILTWIAKNRRTPPALLHQVMQIKNTMLLCQIAGNPNTGVEDLRELLNDPKTPIEVIRSLASNPALPPDIISGLLADHKSKPLDEQVLTYLAANPNTIKDDLRKLATEKSASVRLAVAANPKTPTDTLSSMWGYHLPDNVEITEAVALNPNTSVEDLRKMSKTLKGDAAACVMHGNIALNPTTPRDVFEYLASKKHHPDVRGKVAQSQYTPAEVLSSLENDTAQTKCGISVNELLALNPNTPEKIFRNFSDTKFQNLHSSLAKNCKMPGDILRKLSQSTDEYVLCNLIRNPNTPEDIIEDIFERLLKNTGANYDMLDRIVDSPRMPDNILKKMAQSSDSKIRQAIENSPVLALRTLTI
jgi:ShET2 enterotoxin, N-terminal region